MVMNRKGQAAMEFLMTYGWAILAAVIVIGVLAYFGVFSPSTYVPNQCVLSAPFGCNAGSASVTNGVTLELRHGVVGEQYTVSSIAVGGCGANTTVNNGTALSADTLYLIPIQCTPALVSGTKFRGDVTIIYTKVGSQVQQTSSGQIINKVAP